MYLGVPVRGADRLRQQFLECDRVGGRVAAGVGRGNGQDLEFKKKI